MIEQSLLNATLQTGLLAITIPVVLIVAWKMYTKRSLVPFFVGIMVFITFSRMLEMIPHSLFLLSSNPVSKAINGNIILYTVYAALIAALFEETGRYLAFRFVLTKHPNKETAVTYGIGFLHRIIEKYFHIGQICQYYYRSALTRPTSTWYNIKKVRPEMGGAPNALRHTARTQWRKTK